MIPLELRITNFLSYREPSVLNFDGIHLACITGANGAGKSTILDAVTWALFGSSRSERDDYLVNTEAAARGEMAEVSFIFDLDGAVYRIIRRKRHSKTTELEFQQNIGGDLSGPWKAMTEAKVRETQAAIINLLRMNYDVFTSASFILQGGADEFTKKTPDKRKQVLADILGVNQWEAYRTAAADRRKTADMQLNDLQARIDEIDRELESEQQYREAVLRAEERQASLRQMLSHQKAKLDEKRERKHHADSLLKLVQSLAHSRDRAAASLQQEQTAYDKRQSELVALQELLRDETRLTADYEGWQQNEQRLSLLQAQADQINQILSEMRPHETAIATSQSRLEQQERQLAQQSAEADQAELHRAELLGRLKTNRQLFVENESVVQSLSDQAREWYEASMKLKNLQHERLGWEREMKQLADELEEHGRLTEERKARLAAAEQMRQQLERTRSLLETLDALQVERNQLLAEISDTDARMRHLRDLMDVKRAKMDRFAADAATVCPECGQDLTERHRSNVLEQWQAEGTRMANDHHQLKATLEPKKARAAELDEQLRGRAATEKAYRETQSTFSREEARLSEIERRLSDRDADADAVRLAELRRALHGEAEMTKLTQRVADLEAAAARKQAAEAERDALRAIISRDEATVAQLGSMLDAWHQVGRLEWERVSERLRTQDFAVESRLQLAELARQRDAIGYDAGAHAAARARRAELTGVDTRYQELQQARARHQATADALAETVDRLTSAQATLAEQTAQHETMQEQWQFAQHEAEGLGLLEEEVNGLREAVDEAVRQLGASQQRLKALEDSRTRRQVLETEREETRVNVARLKRLEEAFGRKGVQAWLIDSALPDIQDHANELLDRLTGGSMRVTFSTQKELKSGDTAETLDIKISDDRGIRPYENYSGGEQFRVNFAIRLALSQVLAQRAGASLKTLVIDEGFGTQDPEGRQRLVEAINAVQAKFHCILVITHVDELRDAFPARIEVSKNAGGSRLAVVGV